MEKPVFSFKGDTAVCFRLAQEVLNFFHCLCENTPLTQGQRERLNELAATAREIGLRVVRPDWFTRLFNAA